MDHFDPSTPRWQWIAPQTAQRLSGTVTTDRVCRHVVPKSRKVSNLRRIGREIVESWRLMLV